MKVDGSRRVFALSSALVFAVAACATPPRNKGIDAMEALDAGLTPAAPSCEGIISVHPGLAPTEALCAADHATEQTLVLKVRPTSADEPPSLEGLADVLVRVAIEGELRRADGERVHVQEAALADGVTLVPLATPDAVGWSATLPPDAPPRTLESAALALIALASEPSFGSNLVATWSERHRVGAHHGHDLPAAWAITLAAGQGRLVAPPALAPTLATLNREDLVRLHRRLFTAARVELSLPRAGWTPRVQRALDAVGDGPAPDPTPAAVCAAPAATRWALRGDAPQPVWHAIAITRIHEHMRQHETTALSPAGLTAALSTFIATVGRGPSSLRASITSVDDVAVLAMPADDIARIGRYLAASGPAIDRAFATSPPMTHIVRAALDALTVGVAIRTHVGPPGSAQPEPGEALLSGIGCALDTP